MVAAVEGEVAAKGVVVTATIEEATTSEVAFDFKEEVETMGCRGSAEAATTTTEVASFDPRRGMEAVALGVAVALVVAAWEVAAWEVATWAAVAWEAVA